MILTATSKIEVSFSGTQAAQVRGVYLECAELVNSFSRTAIDPNAPRLMREHQLKQQQEREIDRIEHVKHYCKCMSILRKEIEVCAHTSPLPSNLFLPNSS